VVVAHGRNPFLQTRKRIMKEVQHYELVLQKRCEPTGGGNDSQVIRNIYIGAFLSRAKRIGSNQPRTRVYRHCLRFLRSIL
jgi:hypothetical protein